MRVDRFSIFTLVILGIAVLINLYAPVPHPGTPAFWGSIFQGVLLGVISSSALVWLLVTGWTKSLQPGQSFAASLTLSQTSLLAFCGLNILRGLTNLILIPYPGAAWVGQIIVALQTAGSAALVAMVAPILANAYKNILNDTPEKSFSTRLKILLQFALFPFAGIWIILALVSLVANPDQNNRLLDMARYLSMAVVSLVAFLLSLFHLSERKVIWFVTAAATFMVAIYAVYNLLGL